MNHKPKRRWQSTGDAILRNKEGGGGERIENLRVTDKQFLWTDADIEELKLLKSKNASHHGSAAAKARWKKDVAG